MLARASFGALREHASVGRLPFAGPIRAPSHPCSGGLIPQVHLIGTRELLNTKNDPQLRHLRS